MLDQVIPCVASSQIYFTNSLVSLEYLFVLQLKLLGMGGTVHNHAHIVGQIVAHATYSLFDSREFSAT